MFHALLAPSIFFFPDFLCVIDKAIEGNKNGCPTLWLHVVCVMYWGSNQTSELVHFVWISQRKTKQNKKLWFSSFCWFNRSCYRDWCCSCLSGLLEIKTMISPTQIGAILFMIKVIVIRKHGEQVWNIHWSWSRKTTNSALTWADPWLAELDMTGSLVSTSCKNVNSLYTTGFTGWRSAHF